MTTPGGFDLLQLAVEASRALIDSPDLRDRTWQLQPATIVIADAANPTAVMDGDGVLGGTSTPIPLVSLIGHCAVGGRVMVLRVPPAGNYAVADITGATTESNFDATNFTTTSVSYTTAGANVVGTTFIVPASGKVLLTWSAELMNSAGSFTLLSPQIAEGNTVDSGAVIAAASDTYTARADTTSVIRATNTRLLTVADGAAFTPGRVVNVALYHRVGGGTGTYERRHVTAMPVI